MADIYYTGAIGSENQHASVTTGQDILDYVGRKAAERVKKHELNSSAVVRTENGLPKLRDDLEAAYLHLACLAGHMMFSSSRRDRAYEAHGKAEADHARTIEACTADLSANEEYNGLLIALGRKRLELSGYASDMEERQAEIDTIIEGQADTFRRLYEREYGTPFTRCSRWDNIAARLTLYRNQIKPIKELDERRLYAARMHYGTEREIGSILSRMIAIDNDTRARYGLAAKDGDIAAAGRDVEAARAEVVSRLRLTDSEELTRRVSGERYSDGIRKSAKRVVDCRERISRDEDTVRRWRQEMERFGQEYLVLMNRRGRLCEMLDPETRLRDGFVYATLGRWLDGIDSDSEFLGKIF